MYHTKCRESSWLSSWLLLLQQMCSHFKLFHSLTFLHFHPFFTFLTSSSSLTLQLFKFFTFLTSSSPLTLQLFTVSTFFHLFKLFQPVTCLHFHPLFTFLNSSSPFTLQLFIFLHLVTSSSPFTPQFFHICSPF